MTAEETLKKHLYFDSDTENVGTEFECTYEIIKSVDEDNSLEQSILQAMQEHAEQEAVEFAELLNENFVYVHNGLYRHVATLQDYTITQIYRDYQQFKQRNK
jgi:hypothetical protein